MGFAFLLFASQLGAQGPRIRDLTVEDASVPVRLMGYGLVVGLSGTGDRVGGTRGAVYTVQSVANLLKRFGVDVPAEILQTRNVAAVLVTAEVSPFLRPGGHFDIHVASVGDARSLRGGVLWMTPLVAGPGGSAMASAQGALLASDRGHNSSSESSAQLPAGGLLESEIPRKDQKPGDRLLLRTPDRSNAMRIAAAIGKEIGVDKVHVEDPGSVKLSLDGNEDKRAEQLARIADLRIDGHDTRAMLILDGRSGTVVAGGNIPVTDAVVTHRGVTITVGGAVTTDSLKEGSSDIRVKLGSTAQDIAGALAALRLPASDVAAIFEALRESGALVAEVRVR